MDLIHWIVVFFIIGIINLFIALSAIKHFLNKQGQIETEYDMQCFKLMVKKQMYQALLQIIVLGIMGIIGLVGIVTEKLTGLDIFVFILLNVCNIVLGMYAKKFEKIARTLSVEDELFANEYFSICNTWIKKPFPNF